MSLSWSKETTMERFCESRLEVDRCRRQLLLGLKRQKGWFNLQVVEEHLCSKLDKGRSIYVNVGDLW